MTCLTLQCHLSCANANEQHLNCRINWKAFWLKTTFCTDLLPFLSNPPLPFTATPPFCQIQKCCHSQPSLFLPFSFSHLHLWPSFFSNTCSVFSFNFFNVPTCLLDHQFPPSACSFSTICHSLLSLGKLQLFYAPVLGPRTSLPFSSLSFPIRLPSVLLSLMSFYPHVSINVCFTFSVCLCFCALVEL